MTLLLKKRLGSRYPSYADGGNFKRDCKDYKRTTITYAYSWLRLCRVYHNDAGVV